MQGTERVPGAAIAPQNRFEATFTNLSAATFETTRMGLDPADPLSAQLTVPSGPGFFELTLRGDFGPVNAQLDGLAAPVQPVDGGIRLTLGLTAGAHELTVTPQ